MAATLDDFITSEGYPRLVDFGQRRQKLDGSIRPGDVVYCRHNWGNFFRDVHPKIPVPYVLLSSFHDATVKTVYDELDDQKLLGWFAHNVAIRHPKVCCVPRGIRQGTLRWLVAAQKAQPEKKHLLYSNFHVTVGVRHEVHDMFADVPWCYTVPYDKRNPAQYAMDLASSHFVLSPPGYGEDCYRTWDVLASGAIPVVRSSFLDPQFRELPVLIVDHWEDVTEELLVRTKEEFAGREFAWHLTKQSWWDKRIKAWK